MKLAWARAHRRWRLQRGNSSFLVMNPDCYFVLAMDVIVCTADVGNVLQTSVCTVLEAEVLWSGLDICHDGRTQLKVVQGTLNPVKYRDDIIGPIVLPFLQQRTLNTSFNMTMQDVTWLVFVKTEPESHPCSSLAGIITGSDTIEHLWDELGRRVRNRENPPKTLQELRDALVHKPLSND